MLFGRSPGQNRASLNPSTVIRSEVRLVLVPVTVTDRRGAVVNGLGREHFKLLEEKTPLPIASFTQEDAPCSVGIVFDVSGSMKPALPQAKSTLRAFFETFNPEDEAFLMSVSSVPRELTKFTSQFTGLLDSVRFTSAGGSTAFIDTMYLALNRMREAQHARRALLVISDGMDNHSRYSQKDLMKLASEADVQIHTIALYSPPLTKKPIELQQERQGLGLLEELARRTGGLHFIARDGNDVNEIVAKIGQALRNQYVIGYRPRTVDGSGKWRSIRVKSTLPDVMVYARPGYYAE